MTVEVVTPSYDRLASLRRMLDGLANQTMRGFSVAVVDDCSPQPVADALRGLALPFELRCLKTARNSGPAAARNLAVQTSTADVVVFVDDDVAPVEGLVATHAAAQRGGPGHVTIGPLLSPADWKATPWNRWEAATLAVEYARMQRGVYAPTWRQFFTGNASVWRSDFLAAGGFDESFLRAEDIEFAYRMARRGARFSFLPEAVGWHYAERTLASWRRIPGQYAEFDLTIDRLHPELEWDTLVRREASGRHVLTRAVEHGAAKVGGEHVAATGTIAAARLAHGLGVHSASNRLLSLAFQLEYGQRRRELLRRPPFNAASTVTR